jgi:hypothetical protein
MPMSIRYNPYPNSSSGLDFLSPEHGCRAESRLGDLPLNKSYLSLHMHWQREKKSMSIGLHHFMQVTPVNAQSLILKHPILFRSIPL